MAGSSPFVASVNGVDSRSAAHELPLAPGLAGPLQTTGLGPFVDDEMPDAGPVNTYDLNFTHPHSPTPGPSTSLTSSTGYEPMDVDVDSGYNSSSPVSIFSGCSTDMNGVEPSDPSTLTDEDMYELLKAPLMRDTPLPFDDDADLDYSLDGHAEWASVDTLLLDLLTPMPLIFDY
ncbi:unnamed protein product [Peniophora sp. CBMAI 1063]|nr:unnamed protein product [Peniophora sp. CBMAI 1063]